MSGPSTWFQRWRAFREIRTLRKEDAYIVHKHDARLYAMHLNQLLDEGKIALGLGRLDDALRAWAGVRARFPDCEKAYALPLTEFIKERRFQEAETLAADARQQFPKSLVFAVQHAQVARLRGEPEEAIKRWEAVRHQFPESQSGFVHGAATLAETNRLEEAEALTREAMISFPDASGPQIVYAQLAQRAADWPEALSRWQLVRERFPDRVEAVGGLSRCLHELHRFDELETLATEAVGRFPYEPTVALQYASIAHERGEFETALTRWEWVRDRFPTLKAAYAGSARTLAALGKAEEAAALMQAGRRL